MEQSKYIRFMSQKNIVAIPDEIVMRFLEGFMFEMTKDEVESLRSQIVTPNLII